MVALVLGKLFPVGSFFLMLGALVWFVCCVYGLCFDRRGCLDLDWLRVPC